MIAGRLILIATILLMHASGQVAAADTMVFEEVVGPTTFEASGRTVQLAGIKPPDEKSPYFFAGKMFLSAIIQGQSLSCDSIAAFQMICYAGRTDISSQMVRMGMATPADQTYAADEAYARRNHFGIWHLNGTQGGPIPRATKDTAVDSPVTR